MDKSLKFKRSFCVPSGRRTLSTSGCPALYAVCKGWAILRLCRSGRVPSFVALPGLGALQLLTFSGHSTFNF
jgi:hypothetical protein